MEFKHETCQQYIARRLSEGWSIVCQYGYTIILSPPNGTFLRPVDLRNDIETLRPNAPGDECSIDSQGGWCPVCPNHWEGVSDVVPDDDVAYVRNTAVTSYLRDLYALPASSGSGTINFIKIYFRCSWWNTPGFAKPSLKSDDTITDGTEVAIETEWTTFKTYSQQWDTNPADGQPWGSDWSVIDALQIGVSLKMGAGGQALCTQVYVEVDYTPVGRSFGFIIG
ncbi:unnamed protein product [marine sediment metagenome]|uniref:TGF-beta propeptide domain-containing protein n=1 Tax=marine sediment metagenome TaxID=412755 RepID=X1U003_9ZZZZ